MTIAIARNKINRVLEPFRAGEWWEHKLGPMLATGYMTAFYLRHSLIDLWPTFVATLVAVAAAAAYVCLINDLTDLEEDADAGKYNRLACRSRPYVITAFGAVLMVGVAVGMIAWRDDPLALGLYAGSWVAFSLYSFPPIRLKARGAVGALADASGAHLFPHLLIAVAVLHAANRPLAVGWLTTIATWALASGLRGALWHQLADRSADSRSGVNTFGRLHPKRSRFAGLAAFAIELAAFFILLWRAGSPVAFALLAPYLLLELARVRVSGVALTVVSSPAPPFRIAMHEYYLCWYPLAFLAASAIRHSGDVVVLVLHVAIFRVAFLGMAHDAKYMLTRLAAGLRAAAAPPSKSPL